MKTCVDWIEIAKAEPEVGEQVLVWHGGMFGNAYMTISEITFTGIWVSNSLIHQRYITHWAKLPQPPTL